MKITGFKAAEDVLQISSPLIMIIMCGNMWLNEGRVGKKELLAVIMLGNATVDLIDSCQTYYLLYVGNGFILTGLLKRIREKRRLLI